MLRVTKEKDRRRWKKNVYKRKIRKVETERRQKSEQ